VGIDEVAGESCRFSQALNRYVVVFDQFTGVHQVSEGAPFAFPFEGALRPVAAFDLHGDLLKQLG